MSIGRAAHANGVDQDTGYWTTTSATTALTDRWRMGMTVQTRSQNDFADLERTVLRPSVSYNLFGKTWLTAGYDAHFIELPADRLEQRAWQQWLTIWPGKHLSFSTRVRLEERFIEDVDGTAVRLRIMARADMPLADTGWKLTASNEYFVRLNSLDPGPDNGFDQNRAYLGLGRPLNAHLSLKLGYQMQYINRTNTDDAMIHQLMIGFSIQ